MLNTLRRTYDILHSRRDARCRRENGSEASRTTMTPATMQAGPSRLSPSSPRNCKNSMKSNSEDETENEVERDEEAADSEEDSEIELESLPEPGNGKGKGVTLPLPSQRMPPPTRVRRSHERKSTRAFWADIDLSIIAACVSPIGNWLTGGDHIKNLFLIILLIFYLHQLIEVPWSLYQASLPRKPATVTAKDAESDRTAALAATELRRQELIYLGLTVISPLLGAAFLHRVLDAVGGAESLSWFSTTLFVLATGLRPWSHLMTRLHDRTHALHDAVHSPSQEDVQLSPMDQEKAKLMRKLRALQVEVKELRTRTLYAERLQEVCDDLSEAVGELERENKRQERKAEGMRLALASRFAVLEEGLVQLEQARRLDIDALKACADMPLHILVYRRVEGYVMSFVASILRIPKAIWALGVLDADLGKDDDRHSPPVIGNLKNPNAATVLATRVPTRDSTRLLSPSLPTIPEGALPYEDADTHVDEDSDGTYVSDRDEHGTLAPNARARQKEKRVHSWGRSQSGGSGVGGKGPGKVRASSYGLWAFESAETLALWPYRASVRILYALVFTVLKLLGLAV